jgi:tRNA(adenine34) deaminase
MCSEISPVEVRAIDIEMMQRCIELSRIATSQGELPFATVICDDNGNIVFEVTNHVLRAKDVTRHSELLAVSEAQRILKRTALSDCTLYSNMEPCVMCSFPIRESGIGRVVFGIQSPMMGGFSRWNVLTDEVISENMPERFMPPPQVIPGLLAKEAEKVWIDWSAKIWEIITSRGCFQAIPATPTVIPEQS